VNKRSAIAVAGGLTGALVSGVVGYSVRLHTDPVAAAPATTKPIVKTQTRTITIHRKPKRPVHRPAPPRTVVVHRPTHVIHLPSSGPAQGTTVHHTGGSIHSPQPPTHHTGGSTHAPGPPTHHTGGSAHGSGGGEHESGDGGGNGGD
jgi:hypothetical protein